MKVDEASGGWAKKILEGSCNLLLEDCHSRNFARHHLAPRLIPFPRPPFIPLSSGPAVEAYVHNFGPGIGGGLAAGMLH